MVMLGLMCPSVSLWAGNSNAENGMNVTNELFQAQKIVKGVVTDESGVPLPGVAVKSKGQSMLGRQQMFLDIISLRLITVWMWYWNFRLWG